MNYRHRYHAGNFTEVFKHCVLMLVIQYLQKKDSPICYIDTHAGEGVYDLRSPEAEKTGESRSGIQRALDFCGSHPACMSAYLHALTAHRTNDRLGHYPGSPSLIYPLLRENDRMILNEYHPEVSDHLKQNFYRKPGVSIHQRDAYEFLPAILPPLESRGVVLIDPPFEKIEENQNIKMALEKALQRWPRGVYMIWYPITGARTWDPKTVVRHNGLKKYLIGGFTVLDRCTDSKGLLGSQLLIVNPPWVLPEILSQLLPHLWKIFNINGQGGWSLTPSHFL